VIHYSLFLFLFRILAKFRNWGPQKKKNAAAPKWAYFLPPPLSGSAPFFLYGPLKLRSYVRFFWWTGPTTKWVCTRLFLYGPSLDPLVKKERASERASKRSRHTVETSAEKSLCKVGALNVCFFRNLSVGVLP